MPRLLIVLLAILLAALAAALAQTPAPAIWFAFEPIPFTLDSAESPARHVPETMAGGVAILDYNNDGFPDIYFANGADLRSLRKSGPAQFNRLFANDGHGGFSDVTERAGVAGAGFDNAIAIADYDNDGLPDIFVGGLKRNTLFHNNGNGTFTDVTAKAGLERADPQWAAGAVWADFNDDGRLDLFVVNYLQWNLATEPPCEYRGVREYCHPKYFKPTTNQLFLAKADGTFADVSATSGIRSHPGKGMGAAVADYDLDGRPDIFVTNDSLENFLFHNLGNGRFEEVALKAGVSLVETGAYMSGMGTDFRDIDNDGYPDISLVALDNETFPLFRNTGRGDFLDLTARSRMGPLSRSMAGYSPVIADLDNDGWKDIFVTRGHVQPVKAARVLAAEQLNTVFRNLGGARFEALTGQAGFAAQPPRRHRGSAVGDLNGDGRLDAVVTSISGPAEVWLNQSPNRNHWIAFRLRGTRSNRDGIGARIKLSTPSGTQYNHMTTACGYASSSAGPVHFGLGGEAVVTRVEIQWPSGTIQRLERPKPDAVMAVTEPAQ